MPKKNMTPEERKAIGERLKAARQAKKEKEARASQVESSYANQDVAELIKQVEELRANQEFMTKLFGGQSQPNAAVRTITKNSINLADYPDPRERLSGEPRLEQKAFKQNFTMEWAIRPHRYDAKDGVHYTEPGFRIELWRRAEDPKTGELTDKTFLVQKATFFEDIEAAVQCANEKGLNISRPDEDGYLNPSTKDFMDEMRYLRIRDWLFEIFWPAPVKESSYIREEVFDNSLRPVKILEASSHEPKPIDFSRL